MAEQEYLTERIKNFGDLLKLAFILLEGVLAVVVPCHCERRKAIFALVFPALRDCFVAFAAPRNDSSCLLAKHARSRDRWRNDQLIVGRST
jgi:hypothetical protein